MSPAVQNLLEAALQCTVVEEVGAQERSYILISMEYPSLKSKHVLGSKSIMAVGMRRQALGGISGVTA